MARPLRVEYPGAIYHVMSRGKGRQRLFRDERDFERLLEGLESAVRKFEKQLVKTQNRACPLP